MFTDYNYWCVVPVLACHVGAVAGAWAYYLAIMNNWAEDDKEKEIPAKKEKIGDARNGKGRHYLQVIGHLINLLTLDNFLLSVRGHVPANPDLPTTRKPKLRPRQTSHPG